MLPDVGSRIVQPGVSRPSFSASQQHPQGRPVLDRPGRVLVLELGPEPHVVRGRQRGQADQRCTADGVEQRVVAHRRDCSAAGDRRQDDDASPSPTVAASPPMNRTSSSLT